MKLAPFRCRIVMCSVSGLVCVVLANVSGTARDLVNTNSFTMCFLCE